jgi:hypothetical protein
MLSFDVFEDVVLAVIFAATTAWIAWLGSVVWNFF